MADDRPADGARPTADEAECAADVRTAEHVRWATRVVASELGFVEGPVLLRSGELCVTSIDHGRLYRGPLDGEMSVLADVGVGANGATEGADGTIYVAQSGTKYVIPDGTRVPALIGPTGGPSGVQAVHTDGTVELVTADPVSPNDLCIGPDGLLYVTDPTRARVRSDGRIWRVDPTSGDAELLASVGWYPNGIGFAGDDDTLYVASTGEGRIYRCPITSSGLGTPEVAIEMGDAHPDGFAFDTDGNIVVSCVFGSPAIQIWTLDGEFVDAFQPGDGCMYTNIALSSDGVLVICDTEGGRVLAVDDWPAGGLPLHPHRRAVGA
jgi:gluconolactonase